MQGFRGFLKRNDKDREGKRPAKLPQRRFTCARAVDPKWTESTSVLHFAATGRSAIKFRLLYLSLTWFSVCVTRLPDRETMIWRARSRRAALHPLWRENPDDLTLHVNVNRDIDSSDKWGWMNLDPKQLRVTNKVTKNKSEFLKLLIDSSKQEIMLLVRSSNFQYFDYHPGLPVQWWFVPTTTIYVNDRLVSDRWNWGVTSCKDISYTPNWLRLRWLYTVHVWFMVRPKCTSRKTSIQKNSSGLNKFN